MFSFLPVDKSSKIITSQPLPKSSSTKLLPINPAPPVINMLPTDDFFSKEY